MESLGKYTHLGLISVTNSHQFTKPPSSKGDNWNDLLKEVITFDTVEEFWGVYV